MSTPEIDVRVEPRYLPEQSDPLQETYDGQREEVRGLGVVGHQPLLKPGEGFEYTSGCRLRTPTGTMEGTYFFVKEDGASFEVPIPRFTLDATGQTGGRVLH